MEIFCADCDIEVKCRRILSNNTVCSVYATQRNGKTTCICLPCYIKRQKTDSYHIIKNTIEDYMRTGCWKDYPKDKIELLIIAYGL
jgi:hypothetical protein